MNGPEGGCRAELLPLQFQLSQEPQKFTQLITGTHQQDFIGILFCHSSVGFIGKMTKQLFASCDDDTVVGFISWFVGGLGLLSLLCPILLKCPARCLTSRIFNTSIKDNKESNVKEESVSKIVTLHFNMFVILGAIISTKLQLFSFTFWIKFTQYTLS